MLYSNEACKHTTRVVKAAEKLKKKYLVLNKVAKQWQVLNTTEELKKK